MMPLLDLRSDTVTKPTPGMRAAMAAAEVGDDVYGEDPGINRLEARVAKMFGKESALFVPSGTMSNQICIKAVTVPGDEMLCDANCHVYNWEAGGPAALSGVTCRTIEGKGGLLDLSQLTDKIRPGNDHYVRTRIVALENTHNRGGGRLYSIESVREISAWARSHGLIMHLDGARVWNAIVKSGLSSEVWGAEFDTISVCFSKGLGAPVGSALIGSKEFVDKARRVRKLFGGGMRQGGILAAAATYALDHHFDRLKEDHDNAQILASAIRDNPRFHLEFPEVETNLIWFDVDPGFGKSPDVAKLLREKGIVAYSTYGSLMRVCTHLDVSRADTERAADALAAIR